MTRRGLERARSDDRYRCKQKRGQQNTDCLSGAVVREARAFLESRWDTSRMRGRRTPSYRTRAACCSGPCKRRLIRCDRLCLCINGLWTVENCAHAVQLLAAARKSGGDVCAVAERVDGRCYGELQRVQGFRRHIRGEVCGYEADGKCGFAGDKTFANDLAKAKGENGLPTETIEKFSVKTAVGTKPAQRTTDNLVESVGTHHTGVLMDFGQKMLGLASTDVSELRV